MTDVKIRLAAVGDAEAVRSIYNYEVLHGAATFDLVPRSLEAQQLWIAERSGAFGAIVAIDETATCGENVVGFGALSAYKERAAYRTSVEDSVYVQQGQHGRGIGKLIVNELLSIARISGFHTVFARINSSSTASVGLHTSCGFQLVGVEREVGRKFNRWHDVTIMQALLP